MNQKVTRWITGGGAESFRDQTRSLWWPTMRWFLAVYEAFVTEQVMRMQHVSHIY